MINFFKKGIEFNKLSNSFGKMYLKINRLQPLFNKNETEIISLKNNYKMELLSLVYIANKEIIKKMDYYDWGLEAVFRVNKISSNQITIMYAWNLTITKLHLLIGLFELQKEYEEIMNDGPLAKIIETYVENEKKINSNF